MKKKLASKYYFNKNIQIVKLYFSQFQSRLNNNSIIVIKGEKT